MFLRQWWRKRWRKWRKHFELSSMRLKLKRKSRRDENAIEGLKLWLEYCELCARLVSEKHCCVYESCFCGACFRLLRTVTSSLPSASWLRYFQHRTTVESLTMREAWCQLMNHWCVLSRWFVTFVLICEPGVMLVRTDCRCHLLVSATTAQHACC